MSIGKSTKARVSKLAINIVRGWLENRKLKIWRRKDEIKKPQHYPIIKKTIKKTIIKNECMRVSCQHRKWLVNSENYGNFNTRRRRTWKRRGRRNWRGKVRRGRNEGGGRGKVRRGKNGKGGKGKVRRRRESGKWRKGRRKRKDRKRM